MATLTIPAPNQDNDKKKKRKRRMRDNIKYLSQNKAAIKSAIQASSLDNQIKKLLDITLEMRLDYADFIKEA